VSEALAYKLPFVFVSRDYFNEEPFLRNMLEVEIFQSHLCCHSGTLLDMLPFSFLQCNNSTINVALR
jgi:hypothetical protein